MKIGLIIPVYNYAEGIRKNIESILPHTKHNISVQLYRNSERFPDVSEMCENMVKEYGCFYFPYKTNRGVCLSLNDGLHFSYDVLNSDISIISQQDIWFNSSTAFDNWIDESISYLDSKLVIGTKSEKAPNTVLALSIISKEAWNTVGCLDENLFPAIYDEIDWHIRFGLSTGSSPEDIFSTPIIPELNYRKDINIDFTHATMSVRKDFTLSLQHDCITGPLCKLYYDKKWGSTNIPYKYPFNNSELSYYIPYSKHTTPYGEQYDRKDYGIARV